MIADIWGAVQGQTQLLVDLSALHAKYDTMGHPLDNASHRDLTTTATTSVLDLAKVMPSDFIFELTGDYSLGTVQMIMTVEDSPSIEQFELKGDNEMLFHNTSNYRVKFVNNMSNQPAGANFELDIVNGLSSVVASVAHNTIGATISGANFRSFQITDKATAVGTINNTAAMLHNATSPGINSALGTTANITPPAGPTL